MSSLDGVLILDKPLQLTSTQALYRVRKLLQQQKSGHAGTLDPLATGVLLICLGKATKLVEQIMHLPKIYRTQARLDVTNPGYDCERELIPVPIPQIPTEDAVRDWLRSQIGQVMQVPPAVSAIKVGGRPAYQLERKGRPPELAARPILIHRMQLHAYEWPMVDFELACGRGTYVRAIIRDLGAAMNVGGCLTMLRRLAIGPFTLERATTLAQLEADGLGSAALLPIDVARAEIGAATQIDPVTIKSGLQ